MKAVLLDERHCLAWSDVPAPARRPDEVLNDVRAAAVNRADLMPRAGH